MRPLDLVILILATWRLSHLVAIEDGPFDVFAKLRSTLGLVESANGPRYAKNGRAKLVGCPLCLSVWIGLALYALSVVTPLSWYPIIAIGISGGACAIELLVNRQ